MSVCGELRTSTWLGWVLGGEWDGQTSPPLVKKRVEGGVHAGGDRVGGLRDSSEHPETAATPMVDCRIAGRVISSVLFFAFTHVEGHTNLVPPHEGRGDTIDIVTGNLDPFGGGRGGHETGHVDTGWLRPSDIFGGEGGRIHSPCVLCVEKLVDSGEGTDSLANVVEKEPGFGSRLLTFSRGRGRINGRHGQLAFCGFRHISRAGWFVERGWGPLSSVN